MKRLIAKKVDNEWVVNIVVTQILKSKTDVLKIIKQNGLVVFKPGSDDNKIITD